MNEKRSVKDASPNVPQLGGSAASKAPRGRKTSIAALACASASLLVLSGCLQDPNAGGSTSGGAAAADNAETDSDGIVTILGGFAGTDGENFRASLEEFTAETGIKVEYTGDQDFTNTIRIRAQSGQQPDIALFPQPGGLIEQAEAGTIEAIDTFLDYDELESSLVAGFLDISRLNGRVYGAPIRASVKSLVWYPTEEFVAAGYNTEPADLDELDELAAQILADGTSPWCMGWNADQSTGWVGTDWVEEYMLRMWGPDVYDDWVYHRIPFNDERVIAAIDRFGELIKTEGNVYGGTGTALSTSFGDAMNPAFRDTADCLLMRQANFITTFFPQDVQDDIDNAVGLFAFPRDADGWEGLPVLGGGEIAALMNGNDPDSIAVMQYITSAEFGTEWASAGGWLSPHTTFDASAYPDETTRRIAEVLSNADAFRFDGSDLMPNAVGGGTFWTGMVEWLTGDKTSQQIADEIEASWPEEE